MTEAAQCHGGEQGPIEAVGFAVAQDPQRAAIEIVFTIGDGIQEGLDGRRAIQSRIESWRSEELNRASSCVHPGVQGTMPIAVFIRWKYRRVRPGYDAFLFPASGTRFESHATGLRRASPAVLSLKPIDVDADVITGRGQGSLRQGRSGSRVADGIQVAQARHSARPVP